MHLITEPDGTVPSDMPLQTLLHSFLAPTFSCTATYPSCIENYRNVLFSSSQLPLLTEDVWDRCPFSLLHYFALHPPHPPPLFQVSSVISGQNNLQRQITYQVAAVQMRPHLCPILNLQAKSIKNSDYITQINVKNVFQDIYDGFP